MKERTCLISFVLLICSACQPAITETEMDQALKQVVEDGLIAGFAVSVFNKEDVLFAKGYGYQDLEEEIPYTTVSRQIVASISKTTIGLSLMKCAELGLLALEDPVNDHLPFSIVNPYFPEDTITIRHLTNHTSSIKYSEVISGDYAFSKNDLSLEEFGYHHVSPDGDWYSEGNFSNNPPGSSFEYTNIGAALAALIVEHASGMSFKEFTHQYLFEPLGLTEVSWYASETDSASASLYDFSMADSFSSVGKQAIGIYPVRDLVASVADLTRLCQMVMSKGVYNGQAILQEESVAELVAASLPKNIKGEDFSLNHGAFWIIDKNQLGVPKKVIGHSGGDDGIFSMMWYNPDTELGYILLSNTSRTDENIGAYILLWQSLYRYSKNFG